MSREANRIEKGANIRARDDRKDREGAEADVGGLAGTESKNSEMRRLCRSGQ